MKHCEQLRTVYLVVDVIDFQYQILISAVTEIVFSYTIVQCVPWNFTHFDPTKTFKCGKM